MLRDARSDPSVGSRMPLTGPPCLPLAERALIRDWIKQGGRYRGDFVFTDPFDVEIDVAMSAAERSQADSGATHPDRCCFQDIGCRCSGRRDGWQPAGSRSPPS